MAREEDLALVSERLARLGADPDGVDDRTLAQLARLELAAREERALRDAAREEAARHNLSLSSLATASGLARSTLYNKPLLREYANLLSEDSDPDASEAARLRVELEESRREVRLLKDRDGELVLALADNERLRKRIVALENALRDGGRGIMAPDPDDTAGLTLV